MKGLNLGCGGRFNRGWVNIDFHSDDPAVRAHDLSTGIPFPDLGFDAVYHSHLLEHFSRKDGLWFLNECRRVLKPGGVLRVAVPDLEAIARAYLENLEGARAASPGAHERYEWMTIELLDQLVREKSGGEMVEYLSRRPLPAEGFIHERQGAWVKRLISSLNGADAGAAPGRGFLRGLVSGLKGRGAREKEAELGRFRRSGEVHKWMYDSYSLAGALKEAGFEKIVKRRADESYIEGWKGFALDTDADGTVYKPDSLYMEGIRP